MQAGVPTGGVTRAGEAEGGRPSKRNRSMGSEPEISPVGSLVGHKGSVTALSIDASQEAAGPHQLVSGSEDGRCRAGVTRADPLLEKQRPPPGLLVPSLPIPCSSRGPVSITRLHILAGRPVLRFITVLVQVRQGCGIWNDGAQYAASWLPPATRPPKRSPRHPALAFPH